MSLTQKYDSRHSFFSELETVVQAYSSPLLQKESKTAERERRKELSKERWREFYSFFSWRSMPSFRISPGGVAIYDSHKIKVSVAVAGAIGAVALGSIGAYNAIQSQKNFGYNGPSIQIPLDSLASQKEQKQPKKIGSSNAKIVYDRKDVAVPALEQEYSPPESQETYVDERPTKSQRQRPAKMSDHDYGSPDRMSELGRTTSSNNYVAKNESPPKLKYNPNIANEVTTKASEVNTSGSEGGDLEGALYDPSTKGRTRGYGDYEKGGKR